MSEVDGPPIPPELCGLDGCVFLPHAGRHSWYLEREIMRVGKEVGK